MCALFGWLDYKGKVSTKLLRKLTQSLANAAEERGTDASGIAYVKHGNITIYKRPKPAHKLRFCVPNGASAVMGHTRFTTQGSEKFNYNNHPFYGNTDRKFAFAHNGVLYNDKTIRERFQLPETKIETDSYVAVQLLEQCGKLNFEGLKDMAETVSGNFTFTILDEENTLYFVKGSSPLYLLHFKKLGIYVYASTPSIMKEALELCHFPKSKYDVVKVSDGEILRIDSDGGITQDRFQLSSDWYSDYSFWNEPDYSDDDELDLLLEVCNCFGMTEDDVFEWLEYGLSCAEIEEILMEPRAFRNG